MKPEIMSNALKRNVLTRHSTRSQKKRKMPVDLKTIEAVKALCMLKFYTDHPHDIRELGDIHFDYDGLKH